MKKTGVPYFCRDPRQRSVPAGTPGRRLGGPIRTPWLPRQFLRTGRVAVRRRR